MMAANTGQALEYYAYAIKQQFCANPILQLHPLNSQINTIFSGILSIAEPQAKIMVHLSVGDSTSIANHFGVTCRTG